MSQKTAKRIRRLEKQYAAMHNEVDAIRRVQEFYIQDFDKYLKKSMSRKAEKPNIFQRIKNLFA